MIAALILLALLAGSLVYCVLTVIAAQRYLNVRPPELRVTPPISVLKPLSGVDEGLKDNLVSFFEQDYPVFEVLFAVRSVNDPAVEIVKELQSRYPEISSRLIITGEPPYPNPKVFSLDRMFKELRYDLVVMSDSDIRVTPDALRTLSSEFEEARLGMATCPYRAIPGRSFWSTLEALGLNTEFLGGVLTARMLDGMKFALGPTIAVRKETLTRIGGFDALNEFLAEDFVMGKLAAEAGFGVILSSYVIEHRIGSQTFAANFRHKLRWNRSTRRSRPWGYLGQVFTNPLPLALLLFAVRPAWWPALAVAALFRALSAWAVAGCVLHDRLTRRRWWLLPVADCFNFCWWIAGFFGNRVHWRGRDYIVRADGRYELVQRLES